MSDAKMFRDHEGNDTLQIKIDTQSAHDFGKVVFEKALLIAAEKLADEFIAAHGQKVLAAMSPEAAATLAVAGVGAEMAKAIKETPTKAAIQEKVLMYQRGIFGGVTRIR